LTNPRPVRATRRNGASHAAPALLTLLTLIALPAAAQNRTTRIEVQGRVATFVGVISPQRTARLLEAARGQPVDTLVITSPGGDADAGLALAREVRARGWTVRVHEFCGSACANYVFAAAPRRIIEPGALLMWHGAFSNLDTLEILERYRALRPRLADGSARPEELIFAVEHATLVRTLERLEAEVGAFAAELGIDPRLFTLGHRPQRVARESWTVPVVVMARFGLHGVEAPPDYGSRAYLQRWLQAQQLPDDGQIVALTLDEDGRAVLLP
jgi:hypothetical protein